MHQDGIHALRIALELIGDVEEMIDIRQRRGGLRCRGEALCEAREEGGQMRRGLSDTSENFPSALRVSTYPLMNVNAQPTECVDVTARSPSGTD